MARNGSGDYSKPAGTTAVANATAVAAKFNEVIDDLGNEITASLPVAGTKAMAADLPMGSHKVTGLAAGTTAGDALRYEQLVGAAIAPLSVTINSIKQHAYDWWIVAASDESTNITTGTAKVTFHAPYAATLASIYAGLSTVQSAGSIFTVDVNESGSTLLSTKITIDNSEATSLTAATPPVISDAAIAAGAAITVDVDQVGTAAAKGLKVYMQVSPQ